MVWTSCFVFSGVSETQDTQVFVTAVSPSVISPCNISVSSVCVRQMALVRSSYDSSSVLGWTGDTSPHQQQEYWPSLKTGAQHFSSHRGNQEFHRKYNTRQLSLSYSQSVSAAVNEFKYNTIRASHQDTPRHLLVKTLIIRRYYQLSSWLREQRKKWRKIALIRKAGSTNGQIT